MYAGAALTLLASPPNRLVLAPPSGLPVLAPASSLVARPPSAYNSACFLQPAAVLQLGSAAKLHPIAMPTGAKRERIASRK